MSVILGSNSARNSNLLFVRKFFGKNGYLKKSTPGDDGCRLLVVVTHEACPTSQDAVQADLESIL
jgi:hypothetical protein